MNETLIHQSIKNEFLTKLRASYDETIIKTNQKSASKNIDTSSKEVFDNKEIPAEIKEEDGSVDELNEISSWVFEKIKEVVAGNQYFGLAIGLVDLLKG